MTYRDIMIWWKILVAANVICGVCFIYRIINFFGNNKKPPIGSDVILGVLAVIEIILWILLLWTGTIIELG